MTLKKHTRPEKLLTNPPKKSHKNGLKLEKKRQKLELHDNERVTQNKCNISHHKAVMSNEFILRMSKPVVILWEDS